MANKKFSEFTLKTDPANVDFLVGYDGTDNVRIDPSNLGGGGASDLNGLTDCLVTAQNSQFIGNVPANVTSGAYNNTSLGHNALELITGGDNNIGIGWNAGSAITDGAGNVIVGRSALSGGNLSETVAIGHLAALNATGSNSIHVGSDAGRANSAAGHISIGYQAGYSNTSGVQNTNIGYQAGYSNTTSGYNTNMGYEAGKNNTGQKNTFIGSNVAGTGSGSFNVSVGVGSSLSLSSGTKNTSLGRSAGDLITTGQNNSCLGYQANPAAADSANSVTLGNSSVATLRCAVTSITSLSDERDKSEIKDLDYGLAFIDALQPREFVWDNRPETDKDGEEFYSANKGKKDFGFIAQEVRELDNDTLRLVYSENEEKLELSYGKLVPILVKAIQELKEEVELLKS